MKRNKTVTKLASNYMQEYDVYIDREKHKRTRLKRRLISFGLLVFLVFGSMSIHYYKQRSIQADVKKEYAEMQVNLDDLLKEKKDLNEEIKLLNDKEYVLDIARTNYFFSKKGELIFKIPDEAPSY